MSGLAFSRHCEPIGGLLILYCDSLEFIVSEAYTVLDPEGEAIAGRFKIAFRGFYERALRDDASSQYFLACCYFDGCGVRKSVSKGFQWLVKAAENGSDLGCDNLAKRYQDGNGCKKNTDQAVFYYLKAFELGDQNGAFNAAFVMIENADLSSQLSNAIEILRNGALLGDLDCSHKLGFLYSDKERPCFCPAFAVFWYMFAVGQGSADSMFNLALIFDLGDIVSRDVHLAMYYYELSSKTGDLMARDNLSCLIDEFKE